jgi:hypothetical protein
MLFLCILERLSRQMKLRQKIPHEIRLVARLKPVVGLFLVAFAQRTRGMGQNASMFFSEEKNQKTLCPGA